MQIKLLALTGVIALIVLGICLIYAEQIITPAGVYVDQHRLVDGSVTFTVRTVTYNGPYGPRNAGAIWITNSSNQFVKTIKVWANQYRYTLVRWIQSSNYNTTGAVTSASLNNHQLHTVTWNARNSAGTLVEDGNYNFNVEFTEHNASSSNMGKYKTVSFAKGNTAVDQTWPNETWFRDLHLTWNPVIQNGSISGTVRGANSQGLSGAQITAGAQTVSSGANGTFTINIAPGTYDVSCVLNNYVNQTHNGVVVNSAETTTVDFNLAPVANDDPSSPVLNLRLDQNYPNPFRGSTTIAYQLPKAAPATIAIFNLRGQKVAQLNANAGKGRNELNWDGKDSSGKRLPSGTYFYVLSYQDSILYHKLVLN